MQVTCPNCGAKVTADNINIQRMTAVCAVCDTVFPFDVPDAKAKRRKLKPPRKITVNDADTLQMEFWTNFKLERSEAFRSSAFGGIGLTIVSLVLIGVADVPPLLPVGLLLAAVIFFYWLALLVVNKTHIEMDEDTIRVTRKPLPSLFNQGDEVSLAGVTAIKYEETAISKKEDYDLPRYRVWAEMESGSRRTIVNDVPEDYAVFIAQRLDERLHTNADLDIAQLDDSERYSDDVLDLHEVVRTAQNNLRS